MARLGGDEFIIVLPELKSRQDTAVVARKLIDCLAEPFTIGDRSVAASTSIGVAVYPQDGHNGVTLQKQADDALYRVKQNGRSAFGY